jgi:hypothetical protein
MLFAPVDPGAGIPGSPQEIQEFYHNEPLVQLHQRHELFAQHL